MTWGDPGDECDHHDPAPYDRVMADLINAGYSVWTFRGITTTFRPNGVTVSTEAPFDPLRPWLVRPAHQDNDPAPMLGPGKPGSLADWTESFFIEIMELEKDAKFMDRIDLGVKQQEEDERRKRRLGL